MTFGDISQTFSCQRARKDKVAVVTGAASGIGRGIAAALVDDGCHVVVADIEGQKAEEVAQELAAKGIDTVGVNLDCHRPRRGRGIGRFRVGAFRPRRHRCQQRWRLSSYPSGHLHR